MGSKKTHPLSLLAMYVLCATRLVGWSKVQLNAGESRQVQVVVNPLYLSVYDVAQRKWRLDAGNYIFSVGGSSADLPLVKQVNIK